jgi:hypothetical protein
MAYETKDELVFCYILVLLNSSGERKLGKKWFRKTVMLFRLVYSQNIPDPVDLFNIALRTSHLLFYLQFTLLLLPEPLIVDSWIANLFINGELDKIQNETDVNYFKVSSRHWPGNTEEYHEKCPSVGL